MTFVSGSAAGSDVALLVMDEEDDEVVDAVWGDAGVAKGDVEDVGIDDDDDEVVWRRDDGRRAGGGAGAARGDEVKAANSDCEDSS